MDNITVSMAEIEQVLNNLDVLVSVIPQECKGNSKEASIHRRRWMEIRKQINKLVYDI